MTNSIERPSRLDLAALPRDPQRCLGSLRQQLCATYNYTRQYPSKLEVLNETLTTVLKQVRAELAYQKANEAEQPKETKDTE